MLSRERPRVLILAAHDSDARRWAEIIAPVADVWTAPDAVPSEESIDVVVSDLPACGGAAHAGHSAAPRRGTIGIGISENVDVALPVDFADAELRLACQLLAEIARLRVARDNAARTHQEAIDLAETDPLTGLANRRVWERRLAPDRLRRPDAAFWLALVDLDGFKRINDQSGYSAGDLALGRAARAMAGELRRDDLIARLGGDEFGVLLAGLSPAEAAAVLTRLRLAVARAGNMTASIGYASSQSHRTAADLSAAAERALRIAKQSGGDRIFLAEN
jgi:diguanylate cyclase (GGDEF)-like protein